MQGGNTFGSTATFGTNDANSVVLETNNSAKVTVLSSGEVSIGTAGASLDNTPTTVGRLQVNGQGFSRIIDSTAGSGTTWNADNGNVFRWRLGAVGAATINIHNMRPGGAYMLVVNSSVAGTTTINCFSDSGTTSLPTGFIPANGARVTGTLNKTVYTLMSDGSNCLITWITGY